MLGNLETEQKQSVLSEKLIQAINMKNKRRHLRGGANVFAVLLTQAKILKSAQDLTNQHEQYM